MTTQRKSGAKWTRRKPETLRLRSIEPSLTVGNVEKSLAWYRDVVGFTVHKTWEDNGKLMGVSLVAGRAILNLSQDDWGKGRDRQKGEGFRLYLNTSQAVDEIANAIKERGGQLASEPADMPWGARVFHLVDPDGFKLTISSAV